MKNEMRLGKMLMRKIKQNNSLYLYGIGKIVYRKSYSEIYEPVDRSVKLFIPNQTPKFKY